MNAFSDSYIIQFFNRSIKWVQKFNCLHEDHFAISTIQVDMTIQIFLGKISWALLINKSQRKFLIPNLSQIMKQLTSNCVVL